MSDQPDFCEACKSDSVLVTDSRPSKNGRRRTYRCSTCSARWHTNERKGSFRDVGQALAVKTVAAKIKTLSSMVEELTQWVKDLEKVADHMQ